MAYINDDQFGSSFRVVDSDTLRYVYTDGPSSITIVESVINEDDTANENTVLEVDINNHFPQYSGRLAQPSILFIEPNQVIGTILVDDFELDVRVMVFFHEVDGEPVFQQEFTTLIEENEADKILHTYNGRYFVNVLRDDTLTIHEYEPENRELTMLVVLDVGGDIQGSILFAQDWQGSNYYFMLGEWLRDRAPFNPYERNNFTGIYKYDLESNLTEVVIPANLSYSPLGFVVSSTHLIYSLRTNDTSTMNVYSFADQDIQSSINSTSILLPRLIFGVQEVLVEEINTLSYIDRNMVLFGFSSGLSREWLSQIDFYSIFQVEEVSSQRFAVLLYKMTAGLVSSYLVMVDVDNGSFNLEEERDVVWKQEERMSLISIVIVTILLVMIIGFALSWSHLRRISAEVVKKPLFRKEHMEKRIIWYTLLIAFGLSLVLLLYETGAGLQEALTTTSNIDYAITRFIVYSFAFIGTLLIQLYYIDRMYNIYTTDHKPATTIREMKWTTLIFVSFIMLLTSLRLHLIRLNTQPSSITIGVELRWYEITYLALVIGSYIKVSRERRNHKES